MTILQKQLKLKLKFIPFTLLVLALCFLFASSTLLAQSYADIGEHFLHGLVPANYLGINSQLSTPAFSTPLQSEILEIPELFDNSSRHFRANATNNESANPRYLYEDQDMDALLRLRIQEEVTATGMMEAERLNLENIIILPPLSDNREELIPQLREEIERYNNDIAAGVMNPHERTILLPLNINRSHWVGIVIRLNSEGGVISITYTDPAGFYGVPLHIRLLFQEVYGEDINIEVIYGLIQRDNTGCGPLTIENLIREARGIRGDHYVPRELMLRIRAHHVDIIESHRPGLGFKKRQQANLRSFNDIDRKLIGTLFLSESKDYDECLELGLTPVICGGCGRNGEDIQEEQNNKPSENNNRSNFMFQNPDIPYVPEEIQSKILSYLDSKELLKAELVSRQWRQIAYDDVLWSNILENSFGNETVAEALNIYQAISEEDYTTYSRHELSAKYIYRICGLLRIFGKDSGTIKKIVNAEKGKATILDVKNKKLTSTCIKAIASTLKHQNCNVTELILNRNKIGDDGAKALAEALKDKNCKLTKLNLYFNQIGDAGARALAGSLKGKNSKLTKLNLSDNRIGAAGAIALAEALKDKNCKVTELNLEQNEIVAAGAKALAEALKDPNCKLTKLDLMYSRIGYAGAIALAKALKDPSCKVTALNLCNTKIGVAGVKALTRALKNQNCKVTKLDLCSNEIGTAGTKALAEALKDPNCKVTELDLCDNKIGDDGAKALAEALKDPNCKVTELNLCGSKIGNDGAKAIAEALKDPSCKVTKLDLADNRGNQIGAVSAAAFAEALKDPNCKVTELILGGNYIGNVDAITLAEALKDPNCKVTELDLCNNQIGSTGVEALTEALKNPKCKVTKLNLGYNCIGDADVEVLAKALKDPNCKVTELDLSINSIREVGAIALAEALKDPNCKVTELDLFSCHEIDKAGMKALAEAVLYARGEGREINIKRGRV